MSEWPALRRARRAEWLAANGPCRTCRTWENLTIDHIDPSDKSPALLKRNRGGKTASTNPIWGWPIEKREAELAKCQVLCDPCHKAKNRMEEMDRALHRLALKFAHR